MNLLKPILILSAAFVAVFWEAAFHSFRHLFGVQIDLLPAVVVFASLNAGIGTLCLLCLCGGLFFDSLSANPLGVSVLPLLGVGVAMHFNRELILRDQPFAQAVLGLTASALVPAFTLVLLLSISPVPPLFGWRTLWQIFFMAISGAAATPLIFIFFDWLERMFGQSRAVETSFRPDREIRRGR